MQAQEAKDARPYIHVRAIPGMREALHRVAHREHMPAAVYVRRVLAAALEAAGERMEAAQ